MKLLLILALTFSFVQTVQAVTPTQQPTRTATASAQRQTSTRVDELKERLATRVAQLRQTTPRAIHGTVSQVSVSNMTVDTQTNGIKIELTDDIAVVQIIRGKRTALTTDDIDKNDIVTVFGDYDNTIDILTAKTVFIEASTRPVRIHGTITEINRTRNTFTVQGVDEHTYTIDVETSTRTNSWMPNAGVERSGFSRLQQGYFVSILGTRTTANENTITASRILYLIKPGTPTPSVTAAPTREATPTATIRITPTRRVTPTP